MLTCPICGAEFFRGPDDIQPSVEPPGLDDVRGLCDRCLQNHRKKYREKLRRQREASDIPATAGPEEAGG